MEGGSNYYKYQELLRPPRPLSYITEAGEEILSAQRLSSSSGSPHYSVDLHALIGVRINITGFKLKRIFGLGFNPNSRVIGSDRIFGSDYRF